MPAAFGCSDADLSETAGSDGAGGWLYVQNATSGALSEANGARRRTLTLDGVVQRLQ